jgi:hypothetical protein
MAFQAILPFFAKNVYGPINHLPVSVPNFSVFWLED